MKLILALTIVSTSFALAACGGGFKATNMRSVKNVIPGSLSESPDMDSDSDFDGVPELPEAEGYDVKVGPVETIRAQSVGRASIIMNGDLIVDGNLDININDEGNKVECLNTPEGIKVLASSANFMDSKFSLVIPAGTATPSKLTVGTKGPLTKMTMTISEETGLYTPDRTADKCDIALGMKEKTDILNLRISCLMDELKLDTGAKLELKATINCNLTGSQLDSE